MTTITDFPDIRPSLLLDFANSGRVDPRVSCTRASTATCYGPDGVLRTVASNVPRIDYDPVTGKCLGLLVEEARTNFILNSGDLSQSAWVKSRAAAAVPDADGFCKVVEDGSNNSHYVSQTVTLSASDRVVRLLVKAGERTKAQIEFTGNTGNAGRRVVVDLVAGTVLSNSLIGSGGVNSSSVSARLMSAGVTELTVQLTPTATTGATANLLIILHDGTGVSYQGDGVSGIYVKEVQVEAGVFSTSYIPTNAAAVTRAADIVSFTGAAPLATNFSVVQEVSLVGAPASDGTFGLSVYAEENKRFRFMCSGARNIYFSYKFNEDITKNITIQNIAVGSFVRCALSVTPNSLSVTSSGGEPLKADASVSVGAYPEISLGTYRKTNPIASVSSRIRSLAFYNQALSNSQLKRLTA